MGKERSFLSDAKDQYDIKGIRTEKTEDVIRRIQAIPEVYRGIRFRSKLEAATARALDNQKTTWQYEPKVPLKEDRWCMPDFFLPTYGIYVELRPENLVDERLQQKMHSLLECQSLPVYLINSADDVKELIECLQE
jgi:hypothetical protein